MQSVDFVRKRLLDFLDLNISKKIFIFTDNDEDGLTAAINGKLFLEKNGVKTKVFFYNHSGKKKNFLKLFNSFKPNKTLFFDLNESFVLDIINIIDKNNSGVMTDFVVIDHHQSSNLFSANFKKRFKKNFLIIKPNDFSVIEASKYPTSKMVYDLLGGKEWVAVIGIIGDFSFNQWEDFIAIVSKKYSKKKLFELAEICSCIVSMHDSKLISLFNFLYDLENPLCLFSSSFARLNKDFQLLLESELLKTKKSGEFVKDLDLVFFKTKNKLPSKLSTLFSSKNNNTTIIFYSVGKIFVKCSIRRQDFKVNCNELARHSVKTFKNSSGGGHIPASAVRFPKQYLSEFKKRIINYLEKN